MGEAESAFDVARLEWEELLAYVDETHVEQKRKPYLDRITMALKEIEAIWPEEPRPIVEWIRVDPELGDTVDSGIADGEENIKRTHWDAGWIQDTKLNSADLDALVSAVFAFCSAIRKDYESTKRDRDVREAAKRLLKRSALKEFRETDEDFEERASVIEQIHGHCDKVLRFLNHAMNKAEK